MLSSSESRVSSTAITGAAGKKNPRIYSREAVLFGCIVLLVLFVLVTAAINRMYHRKIHALADAWFAQGEASFQAGDIQSALIDYRNAMVYSPGNAKFQFHLAQTLAAAGRGDEGRTYLLNLLSESPGSGEVNLALARIAARKGGTSEAIRYYHAAIYGEWESNPIAMRWQVRRELSEYLLDRGEARQAVPEIIALADDTPTDDPERRKVVANLLLRAKLWPRALDGFRALASGNNQDHDALLGAAISAFELGQYDLALDYFDQLTQQERETPDVVGLYQTAQQISAMNPFIAGLSREAKARRAADALSIAGKRLQECASQEGHSQLVTPPQTPLQKTFADSKELEAEGSFQYIEKHPEVTEDVMAHVFEMENAAADACGKPQGADRALWLLGRSRGVPGQ
jgi:tetratricopeptide (TPR) repeat protein